MSGKTLALELSPKDGLSQCRIQKVQYLKHNYVSNKIDEASFTNGLKYLKYYKIMINI